MMNILIINNGGVQLVNRIMIVKKKWTMKETEPYNLLKIQKYVLVKMKY